MENNENFEKDKLTLLENLIDQLLIRHTKVQAENIQLKNQVQMLKKEHLELIKTKDEVTIRVKQIINKLKRESHE